MPHATVNGVDLFYTDQGSGPPVVFQHGYTSSQDCWHGVIPRLADRYRCIALDARGAGQSAHPAGGYTVAQYARDVVGLADALGLATFTYVGLSMGGTIGFELGLSHASRLEKLVLVAPAPADGIQAPPEMHEHSRSLRQAGAREQMLRERILTSGRPDPEYLARAVDASLSCSTGHFEDSWESLRGLRLGGRLHEITTPTLVVAGAADGLLPANLADFQRLGNATLHVFSRVGHGIPYEVPAGLSRVLADFLGHGVVTARTLQARLREEQAANP